ncbi:MAG: acetolactate synthase small subunit [Caulobacteraceae bacterium]|nr:acetolactate synthase small subunit [Caulobacteraceae bacterium]
MAGRLEGKIALITGAASGIGLGAVELFVAEGACVVAADMQDEKGAMLQQRFPETVRYIHCNVTQEADIARAVALADSQFGGLDILFNNAGHGGSTTGVADMDADGWDATFALLVDNEAGVLHRVVGLFAARGYNIESLTVAETDRRAHTSRITVVTRGAPHVLDQIEAQLQKVVSVRRVQDVTRDPNGVERELALVKVRGTGGDRVEALRVSDIFRAKVIDTTSESFVFEITGAPNKIDSFVELMRPLGLVELSRTGVLSIERGPEAM